MAHAGPGAESDVYDCLVLAYLSLNRCVTRVCCKSARYWLAAPRNSTHVTDGCGVGQLLCK